MGKIRDFASEAHKQKREKKLKSYGLNCYLTEGVSARFLQELDRFSTSVYLRYAVKDDLDFYLDEARDKVLDLLPAFDPSKGSLVTFIFSALRNKATNISRAREKVIRPSEGTDYFDSNGGANGVESSKGDSYFDRIESRQYVSDDLGAWSFKMRAEELGIEFDAEAVDADLREGVWSPMAVVAAWLKLKEESA